MARTGASENRTMSRKRKRILLCVTGLSPQVVTETVYALAVVRKPAWIPHEVRVATTAEGAERARLMLLGRSTGWFPRLLRDWKLPRILFRESSIRAVTDPQGRPMADIRSAGDNLAVADFLLQEIRAITSDPGTELHVSIAGGRKTMGFFAGYALSLCGRPQDVLSHVLVDPPFESHTSFFYPSPVPQVIYTPPPESRPLDTSQARVTLAEIPFIRLRRLLQQAGSEAARDFAGTIEAAQEELDPAVVIDFEAGCLRAGGRQVQLPPAELAFYAMLARATKTGLALPAPSETGDAGPAQRYLSEYRRIPMVRGNLDRVARALAKGMDRAYFLERKARVAKALEQALGRNRAALYGIRAEGQRPETVYRLALSPESIHFTGEPGE